MSEMGIEAKIEKLMQMAEMVHDRFHAHEWEQDYRPFDEGREFRLQCWCGKNVLVTHEEFRKQQVTA